MVSNGERKRPEAENARGRSESQDQELRRMINVNVELVTGLGSNGLYLLPDNILHSVFINTSHKT